MFSSGGSSFLGAVSMFPTAAADLRGGDRFSDPFGGRLSSWPWSVVVGLSIEVTFNGGDSGGAGVAVGCSAVVLGFRGGDVNVVVGGGVVVVVSMKGGLKLSASAILLEGQILDEFWTLWINEFLKGMVVLERGRLQAIDGLLVGDADRLIAVDC
ncbi:hypothetical protein Tco_0411917 [Tanacetum coccineum]